jgi:hypothetical protein
VTTTESRTSERVSGSSMTWGTTRVLLIAAVSLPMRAIEPRMERVWYDRACATASGTPATAASTLPPK